MWQEVSRGYQEYIDRKIAAETAAVNARLVPTGPPQPAGGPMTNHITPAAHLDTIRHHCQTVQARNLDATTMEQSDTWRLAYALECALNHIETLERTLRDHDRRLAHLEGILTAQAATARR